MTLPSAARFWPSGRGQSLSPRAGTRATFKVRASDTNGAYALVEWDHEPDTPGPPVHVHDAEEEAFYVLAGQVSVTLGTTEFDALPGSFVLVPRGTAHTFSVLGPDPAKLLIILSPPGYEGFWEELSIATADGTSQADRETMARLGAKYRMQVLPPP